MIWTASPVDGVVDHDGRVGRLHDLQLGLADADGLEEAPIAPGGVEEADRLARCGREPAEVAAGGHAPDEDAGIERVADHADAVAQDRAPGERARRVDGDDSDAVPAGPPAFDDLVAQGALAASREAR